MNDSYCLKFKLLTLFRIANIGYIITLRDALVTVVENIFVYKHLL